MVENGSMSPEVVNMDHDATAQQFMQSRAAMYQEGPWRLSGIEGNVSFAWDVAPLPAGPARQATSLGGEGLAIKAGKSEAAAWKFIEFTQAPDRALELAVGTRGLPVREDFLNASELFKTGKLSVFAKQMPFACARGPHPEMPKIEQAIMTMIHSVIIGTATPEAAAAAAAKDVAQYYK
jgi:multiple sugar transport system substrate-binding protein